MCYHCGVNEPDDLYHLDDRLKQAGIADLQSINPIMEELEQNLVRINNEY